ncbi:MAG: uracil-DNA glycosylase [Vicinamibacterales bacterium]
MTCEQCPRLRSYCREVGRIRKAAFRNDVYWARPVPGFGDAEARILILGLAPAAHGANRTGRLFTGDGVGASGDFLISALHRAGLANIPTSQRVDDGLQLTDVYIAAAVRCAPPDNKPLPEEVDRCLAHLDREIDQLPRLQIVVALGKIAWDAWLKLLIRRGIEMPKPRPVFGHGAIAQLSLGTQAPRTVAPGTAAPGTLIGLYHPSRQNTNTGVVTPQMYDRVFRTVRESLR